jgi:hypothetical protein
MLLGLMFFTTVTTANANICDEAYENEELEVAFEVCKDEADNGNIKAQYRTAYFYDVGLAAPFDDKKAAYYYELAAEEGMAEAQFELAFKYRYGNGVMQNYEKTVQLFRAAAEQGLAKAQSRLAEMYEAGELVEKDYSASLKWQTEAAEQGISYALFDMGKIYRDGKIATANAVKAHMYFNLAAAEGFVEAPEARAAIQEEMTHEQIIDAQRRAKKCLANKYKNCN